VHLSRPQLLADVHAAHARQAQIHQDQVRFERHGLLEPALPVARQQRPVARLFQHDPDRVAEILVVVDDQYRLHVP